MLTIELTPSQEESLNNLAAELGKSKVDLVRQMIDEAIEDAIDAKAADAVLTRIRSGEERTYSSEEIRRDLGLDD